MMWPGVKRSVDLSTIYIRSVVLVDTCHAEPIRTSDGIKNGGILCQSQNMNKNGKVL